MATNKNKKLGHNCPKIPDHYGDQFTGPACPDHASFAEARTAWFRFLRQHQFVTPLPRTTHGSPHSSR
jgi:hypothetical protein